jgi:hypothetical protein
MLAKCVDVGFGVGGDVGGESWNRSGVTEFYLFSLMK